MSCSSLSAARAKTTAELARLEPLQEKAAKDDRTAFVVGGLIGAAMYGQDHGAAISRLKGEVIAIDRARAAKSC